VAETTRARLVATRSTQSAFRTARIASSCAQPDLNYFCRVELVTVAHSPLIPNTVPRLATEPSTHPRVTALARTHFGEVGSLLGWKRSCQTAGSRSRLARSKRKRITRRTRRLFQESTAAAPSFECSKAIDSRVAIRVRRDDSGAGHSRPGPAKRTTISVPATIALDRRICATSMDRWVALALRDQAQDFTRRFTTPYLPPLHKRCISPNPGLFTGLCAVQNDGESPPTLLCLSSRRDRQVCCSRLNRRSRPLEGTPPIVWGRPCWIGDPSAYFFFWACPVSHCFPQKRRKRTSPACRLRG